MTPPDVDRCVAVEPCPFCGVAPKVDEYHPYGGEPKWAVVSCNSQECGQVVFRAPTEAEAIAAWNRRALRQGGGWLPIESAPKGGNYILASDGEDTGCAVVRWDEGGWCYAWHPHDGPMQMHSATHWQPLPAPPSPAKEG